MSRIHQSLPLRIFGLRRILTSEIIFVFISDDCLRFPPYNSQYSPQAFVSWLSRRNWCVPLATHVTLFATNFCIFPSVDAIAVRRRMWLKIFLCAVIWLDKPLLQKDQIVHHCWRHPAQTCDFTLYDGSMWH